MISDVCSDAVAELDHYLGDELFDGVYTGELRARIVRLRDELEQLGLELDKPPTPELEGRAVARTFLRGPRHRFG